MGRHLSYLEFPSEFVWHSDSKSWSPRRNNKSSIGRLAYVHPTSGELFFLRMLLCHRKGCRDFFEVQIINGVFYPTYRAACEALGLLGDDKEWETALEEACVFANSEQLSQDIPKKVSEKVQIPNYHLNADSLQGYTLYELQIILNNYGKLPQSFGLSPPPVDLLEQLANRLLMEERNYNREELIQLKNDSVPRLKADQKAIYDLIINANANSRQEFIFVYSHGGTGKTFLWKTIISSLRSQGKIVLAVAYSGIASLLLPSGRTAHSRFKLPLELMEESLYKSLEDIVNKPFSLFGGNSILLGGDFRQTLPIKKGASKMEIITSCISESALWPSFKATLQKRILKIHLGSTFLLPTASLLMNKKAIICPKNETTDIINFKVLDMVPGESTSYMSQDEATPTRNDEAEIEMLYPVEHLNTLKLPGFPPHHLEL
ncbi:DNA helicase [Tanacetum coccineum]